MALFEATDVLLEEGVYVAQLKDIRPNTRKKYNKPDETEDCYDWTFGVVEEGYEGVEVYGRTSTNFGPSSNARTWVQALLGRKVEQGEELDLPDLKGKECMLSIYHNETDRGTFANINSVNPVRRGSRKTTADEASKIRNALGGKSPDPELGNDEEMNEIPF